MNEERRKFKRYRIPEVTGSLLFQTEAEVINVSLSGLALEAKDRLDVDRSYQIGISFDEERLQLDGKVIWCQSADSGDVHRAGLEFRDIWTPEALQLLRMIQSKVLADLDTRLVRRFQSQKPGSVELSCNYDFLVKCISLSGMEIETEFWPPLDRFYDLEINLRDTLLTFRGRTVNARHDNPRINPLYQLGVEFEEISSDGYRQLEEFIDKELAPKS